MKKHHINFPRFLLLVCGIGCSLFAAAQDTTGRRNETQQQPEQRRQYQYRDLKTGQNIQLRYDRTERTTYNAETGEPVDFYLNTTTGDTTYGRGQYIVNTYMLNNDGNYSLDPMRVRVAEDGIYMIEGNKMLKTEKPYRAYMKAARKKQ